MAEAGLIVRSGGIAKEAFFFAFTEFTIRARETGLTNSIRIECHIRKNSIIFTLWYIYAGLSQFFLSNWKNQRI